MRRLFKSILILLLGLPVIVFIGWIYLQSQLKQAGISHWSLQLSQLSLHQVKLAELQFTLEQPDYLLTATLEDLQLDWSWPAFFRVKPQSLLLQSANIDVQHVQLTPSSQADSPRVLPTDWQIPTWLPQLVQLEQLTLTLPCPKGRCQLQASGQLSADDAEQWQAKLQLASPEHQLTLHADFYYQHHATDKALQASIQLDQQLALSLKQQLNSDRQARTELALSIAPPSTALLAMLADWQLSIPQEWLTQFNQPVQLYAAGDWRLPTTLAANTAHSLPLADADFRLIARAPDPFIIPGLGWLKGEINTELKLSNHQLEHWQLDAELELSRYAEIAYFGASLAPLQITLHSGSQLQQTGSTTTDEVDVDKPADTTLVNAFLADSTQGLPLTVTLKAAAPLRTEIQADLMVSLQPALKIALQQGVINLNAKVLNGKAISAAAEPLQVSDLSIQSTLTGFWQADDWQFNLADNSQISGRFTHPAAQGQLLVQLANTELKQHATAQVALHSQAVITVQQLIQSQLKTQNWQWQAELTGTLRQLALNGKLSNDSGLSIPQQVQWQAPSQLHLDWQVEDIYLLAGNSLKNTFTDWPELLDINRGRLAAAGQVRYQNDALTAQATLNLRELNGLYDRTLFNGLTSQLALNLEGDNFTLNIPALQLTQLNHGMQMGPLSVNAHYSASLAAPLAGKLQLNNVTMNFMQGELAVTPQLLDFTAPEQQLVLTIQQLDLAELLRQHPTTDLSANGKLSGRIPVIIKGNQFSVQQGTLAAEQPGGRLQYRTAASAAGSSNTGMKLVFDALEDFHFTVLNSELSYSHEGKLLLALQLNGFNPALQQGRAINLNINLEEDLPAMITSLQLTNKLNDTLTKRVQQYIQRQQAAKPAAGENP